MPHLPIPHRHGLHLLGELRYLLHSRRYEPCGCLVGNINAGFGHRPQCHNAPWEPEPGSRWRSWPDSAPR